MGQYHKVVNLDKKEFIHGHHLDIGLKLMEQCGFEKSTADAVWLLLAASNGRGGGDARTHELIGHWAGDKIAVIGDYAEPADVPGIDASEVYNALEESYTDISGRVKDMLRAVFGDAQVQGTMRPDILLTIPR